MGRPKKQTDSPEERLTQFFLKSVGVELGYWNAVTETFSEDAAEQRVYQSNISLFEQAMKHGWTYDDLHHLVGSNYKNGVRAALLTEILPKKDDPLKEGDNLLQPDQDYYHSALYNVSAPRFAVAGAMMIPVSRGSTSLKEVFTLRDLMDYYYENIKTACIAKRREAQTKTMIWLLGQATLDEILYAIDAASLTEDDVQVVELANYLDQGRKDLTYHRSRSM